MRTFSPARSLSTKLILFLVLILVGSMTTLTLISNNMASENLIEIADERIDAQAYGAVERIDLYFFERQGDLSFFASLLSVRSLLQNEADDQLMNELETRLNLARDTYGYDAISVLDLDGEVIYSTLDELSGQQRGMHEEVMGALQGETAVSPIHADPGTDTVYFHIASPVLNSDGDIIGVVDARATTAALDEIVASDTGRTGEGSFSVLLDEHLIRISIPANPDSAFKPVVPLDPEVKAEMIEEQRFGSRTAELLNDPSNATYVAEAAQELRTNPATEHVLYRGIAGSTGIESEGVMRRLDNVPWFYQHRVPTESFLSTVTEQTRSSFGVTVLAALAAIGVMVLFARYAINVPLNQLVGAAQALEHGELSRRLTMRRRDEIGQLANSFNEMAESLESRISAEQQAQNEARQLQEQEREGRQVLEDTVAHYLAFMQEVGRGDLQQRLDVRQNGALGALGTGLNDLVGNMHTLTGQVKQASANIAAAASEILAATTQQSSSAAEQSSAVTQTSTTVEEVKTIAQQTAQQAEQVAHDSQEALNVAHQGTRSVEETVQSMEQIRQRVEGIAQTILALSEQTQAIGTIITTVSELADQSNLLALNAAIEAARAGEQGKSFAVVAQNVRELAERSKGATQQVSEILEEIQRATNAAVMVTEEGSKGVESGTQLANDAGQVIHRIAGEVEGGAQANVQMAAAARQQTTGMEQIGQAMTAIQQSTSQALASTRQAERAAKDLHELAQSLQQTIDVYRL
jgi:methyl-accepting chemotaxis protein